MQHSETQKKQYVDIVFDKISTLIKFGIWENLNQERFKRWRKQFEDINEKYFAAYLANKLIYYNKKDFLCLIRWSFTKTLKDIALAKINVKKINNRKWKNEINKTSKELLICPLASVSDPAASGNLIARLLRDQKVISEKNLCSTDQLISNLKKNKYKAIAFVDDMMGSGNQARRFFSKTKINNDNTIKGIIKSFNIPAYLIIAVAPIKTIKDIEQETYFNVKSAEILTDKHCTYRKMFWHDKEFKDGQNFFDKINKKFNITQGAYDNNSWPIAFEHGIPNVTCPFYWDKNNDYISLLPRRGVNL